MNQDLKIFTLEVAYYSYLEVESVANGAHSLSIDEMPAELETDNK